MGTMHKNRHFRLPKLFKTCKISGLQYLTFVKKCDFEACEMPFFV